MGLADSIIGVESGGNATARNPRSSATGAGQFIASTWLDMIQRHRPDLAGLPRDEQLALRNDPALSRDMTNAYADDNGRALKAAGFEATPGNVYLAHFAGPAGATSVLGADPATPVSSVLPSSAIDANPFLRGMTASDLQGWANRKMGGASAPSTPLTTPGAPTGLGAFGLAGPTVAGTPDSVTPAAGATMQEPAAKPDDGPDVAKLLQALAGMGGKAPATAQAAAAPAPAPLQPVRRAAPTFDPTAYLGMLQRSTRR